MHPYWHWKRILSTYFEPRICWRKLTIQKYRNARCRARKFRHCLPLPTTCRSPGLQHTSPTQYPSGLVCSMSQRLYLKSLNHRNDKPSNQWCPHPKSRLAVAVIVLVTTPCAVGAWFQAYWSNQRRLEMRIKWQVRHVRHELLESRRRPPRGVSGDVRNHLVCAIWSKYIAGQSLDPRRLHICLHSHCSKKKRHGPTPSRPEDIGMLRKT